MRSPVATIDLAAVRSNYQVAKRAAAGGRVLAVVKGDAYGHGMLEVAAALSHADGFAVSTVAEGCALRDAGLRGPVLVLHGFTDGADLATMVSRELDGVVHQLWQVEAIERDRPPGTQRFWLKVDTGMGRLGFAPDLAVQAYRRLSAHCAGRVIVMTHFACADDLDSPVTEHQLEVLDSVRAELAECEVSAANSAAIMGWPQALARWNRAGIMLYGANPFTGRARPAELTPAMRFSARLVGITEHQRGDTVGYGQTWTCDAYTRVGLVEAGYCDGYPRSAASGTPVAINGQRCALLGRVSMNSIAVDVTAVEGLRAGDEVELWGEHVGVDEVAAAASTIGYELLCRVSGARQHYLGRAVEVSETRGVARP